MQQVLDALIVHVGLSMVTDILQAIVLECTASYDDALVLYRKVSGPCAQMAWVHLACADNARLAGREAEALGAYKTVLQIDPTLGDHVTPYLSAVNTPPAYVLNSLYDKVAASPDNLELTRQLFDAQLSASGNRFGLPVMADGPCAELRHWRLVLQSKLESQVLRRGQNK